MDFLIFLREILFMIWVSLQLYEWISIKFMIDFETKINTNELSNNLRLAKQQRILLHTKEKKVRIVFWTYIILFSLVNVWQHVFIKLS